MFNAETDFVRGDRYMLLILTGVSQKEQTDAMLYTEQGFSGLLLRFVGNEYGIFFSANLLLAGPSERREREAFPRKENILLKVCAVYCYSQSFNLVAASLNKQSGHELFVIGKYFACYFSIH
jgi:hypothetical protein